MALVPPFLVRFRAILVFHHVKRENVRYHSTAVRMTCAGIALMSVLVLCKMNADIHICNHDPSNIQQLAAARHRRLLHPRLWFLSMIRHKFKKPYRPTPTLEADIIPPLPTARPLDLLIPALMSPVFFKNQRKTKNSCVPSSR
jgi:hypothetical protein